MYVPGTTLGAASTDVHNPLPTGKPAVSVSVREGVAEVLWEFKRESNSSW